MRHTTLCFLVRGDDVLLALKKRGFGVGKLNGVGGKVEAGESAEAAIIRECQEEIGVTPKSPRKLAELSFSFPERPEWNQICAVFVCDSWDGIPVETEEMAPEWHPVARLPFERMWEDDPHWLPQVLRGVSLRAAFSFDASGSLQPGHTAQPLTP